MEAIMRGRVMLILQYEEGLILQCKEGVNTTM